MSNLCHGRTLKRKNNGGFYGSDQKRSFAVGRKINDLQELTPTFWRTPPQALQDAAPANPAVPLPGRLRHGLLSANQRSDSHARSCRDRRTAAAPGRGGSDSF